MYVIDMYWASADYMPSTAKHKEQDNCSQSFQSLQCN